MPKLFLILSTFTNFAYGQVVTSSIDPTLLSFNPSASTTRSFGGIFTSITDTKTRVKGTETGDIPDQGITDLDVDWDVSVQKKKKNEKKLQ